MCRLMCCITGHGDAAVLLADVVLWPDRSISKQSYYARERKGDPALGFHLAHGALNADGFGIGWFSTEDRRARDPTPCVFTSVTPAWNNENLARLACKIVSPIIFAHVRAAYPGMPVSEQNCHPFMFGRYLWMHNGVVAGFAQSTGAVRAANVATLLSPKTAYYTFATIMKETKGNDYGSLPLSKTCNSHLEAGDAALQTSTGKAAKRTVGQGSNKKEQ